MDEKNSDDPWSKIGSKCTSGIFPTIGIRALWFSKKVSQLEQRSKAMEIFRLDKAIDNEKLDLEMAITQLKKAKEKLSQSLKRRKDLAIQMNDHIYIEERIEDIHSESNSNEANEEIKELLEKNGILQEEIRNLKNDKKFIE